MEEGNSLLFMRARFYSPALGRFASADPIGLAGGDHNSYRYVGNDSADFIDVDGKSWIDAAWTTTSFVTNTLAGFTGTNTDKLWAAGKLVSGVAPLAFNLSPIGRLYALGEAVVMAEKGWVDVLQNNWERPKSISAGGGAYTVGGFAALPFYYMYYAIETTVDAFGKLLNYRPPYVTVGSQTTSLVVSHDPNDKLSPGGFGPSHFIQGSGVIPYTVEFENQSSATAPAQKVVITDTLDPNLDLFSFELTEIAFANHTIRIPAGRARGRGRTSIWARDWAW